MSDHVPTPTSAEEIPGIVAGLRAHYNKGVTRQHEWRIKQLKGLVKFLEEKEKEWVEAMNLDMGSHLYEASLLIENAKSDISHTISHLSKWLAEKKISNPWALYPGGTRLRPEPYGVVCDFIPYNYPMYLGFTTLVPILAAGNTCLFKPSSNTPACAALYQQFFPEYLDPEGVKVVCGPSSICDVILDQRFDFIFYTGSPNIAKNVLAKAAPHLTPCILELGGKSPVYVDKNLSIETCARRLVFGRMYNGGQTCVAPDYCLVHESVFEAFKNEVVKVFQEFYGDVTQENDNISHIINKRHYDRIIKSIDTSGGNIVLQGARNPDHLYIGPTLVENPSLDSQLMTEEVFGPVIILNKVNNVDEAIDFINSREKPLALYVLSSDSSIVDKISDRTSSGAIMMNDTTFHVASSSCPFGGIGNSGMGQYHGKYGVRALSHMKPVLTHTTLVDITTRYPPYSESKLNFIKKFA